MDMKLNTFASQIVALGALLCVSFGAGAAKTLDLDALRASNKEGVVATSVPIQFGVASSIFTLPGVPLIASAAKNRADGQAIAAEYGIVDPSIGIANRVGQALGNALALQASYAGGSTGSAPAFALSARSPKAVAQEIGGNKLAVDIRSIQWSVDLFGGDRFRVLYAAKAQVIDTASSKVLASKECVVMPKRKAEAPAAAGMFENGASSLKSEIQAAADQCSGVFINAFVNQRGKA
jgi:hypothetical protein